MWNGTDKRILQRQQQQQSKLFIIFMKHEYLRLSYFFTWSDAIKVWRCSRKYSSVSIRKLVHICSSVSIELNFLCFLIYYSPLCSTIYFHSLFLCFGRWFTQLIFIQSVCYKFQLHPVLLKCDAIIQTTQTIK